MRFICVIVWLVMASPALAYDVSPLFRRGAWTVEHVHDSVDGDSWCSADTTNPAGPSFSLSAFDTGYVGVMVYDPGWNLRERPVSFRIDIDYSIWTIEGQSMDSVVTVSLTGEDDATRFLGELMSGSAVAVYNDAGDRVAGFSLRGSSAALMSLFECWGRINRDSGGRDPFTRASDPF